MLLIKNIMSTFNTNNITSNFVNDIFKLAGVDTKNKVISSPTINRYDCSNDVPTHYSYNCISTSYNYNHNFGDSHVNVKSCF